MLTRRSMFRGLAALPAAALVIGRHSTGSAQEGTPPSHDMAGMTSTDVTATAAGGIVVTVDAVEFAFDAPDQLEAGWTTIRMVNRGAEPHHGQIIRLNDGVSVDQFMALLPQGEAAIAGVLTAEGGPGVVAPTREQTVVVNLREGTYLLVCFVSSADGLPHIAKGMMHPFAVVPVTSHPSAPEPAADAEISMGEFFFEHVPASVTPGQHIWKISNDGEQLHEFEVLQVLPGSSAEVAIASLLAETPAPSTPGVGSPAAAPYTKVGGFQGINPGGYGYAIFDLEPAEYVAACYVPDFATGKPHLMLGMITSFVVG